MPSAVRPAETAPPARGARGGERALDAVGLAVLAVLLRLPATFAAAHLHFDDGVYGVSALAMRDGARPFRDVFSPQGPLHLPLLRLADLAGGEWRHAPRLLPLAAGVLATVATYLAARRLGSRAAALLAGVLVATTGSMLWTTGPITGDGPATAFALAAVAAALAYRDRPSVVRAALTGVLVGAALTTKAIVAVTVLPVGVWLLWHRRVRDAAVAVGAAVGIGLVTTLPFGFGRVWEQSVEYHQRAERLESVGEQASKLVTTLGSRDLPLLAAVVAGLVAAVLARRTRRGAPERTDTWVLAGWFVAGAVVLVVEPTMFRNHLASLVPPLVLLAALHPPPARVFAVALVFLGPWWALHLDDVLLPDGYQGAQRRLTGNLAEIPRDDWVISDEPGFAWRTGHRMPAWLNDASIKRIEQGMITTEVLAREAARPQVCAVVVWSYRYGAELPGLPDALREEGYEVAAEYGTWRAPDGRRGPRRLWTRHCMHARE